MFKTLSILLIFILNIVVVLLFILIGGVIPLIERKYLSLIQRRVGPKFVGYNGRLQFLADALKLLFKEIIYLIHTNKVLLVIIPVILLNLNIIMVINITWFGNIYLYNTEFFLFFIFIIESVTNIFLTYTGMLVKNKYTIIASVRLVNGVIVFEIFLTSVFMLLYLIHNSISLNPIQDTWLYYPNIITYILLVPLIIYLILINLKKVPFDLIEAETEIIMGYAVEHSGFLAGGLLLIEYLHLFFWSYFLAIFI